MLVEADEALGTRGQSWRTGDQVTTGITRGCGDDHRDTLVAAAAVDAWCRYSTDAQVAVNTVRIVCFLKVCVSLVHDVYDCAVST